MVDGEDPESEDPSTRQPEVLTARLAQIDEELARIAKERLARNSDRDLLRGHLEELEQERDSIHAQLGMAMPSKPGASWKGWSLLVGAAIVIIVIIWFVTRM